MDSSTDRRRDFASAKVPETHRFLSSYMQHLRHRGLSAGLISDRTRTARHLCFWLDGHAVQIGAVDARVANRFLNHDCECPAPYGFNRRGDHNRGSLLYPFFRFVVEAKLDLTVEGERVVSLAFTRDPAKGSMADLPGVYCLRTNLMDWDAERLWKTYVTLTDLEAVFRCLKSELGLRPIHHRAPRRTEGHLFIAVLAYQLVQIVRRRLRENGHTESWSALRNRLAPRCRVTATFRCADGRTLHLRKATAVEPHQKPIYDTLGIDPDAGGFVKKVI